MSDVFLSYNRRDEQIMNRIRDKLELAGFSVWTDRGLTVGTRNWEDAIDNALRAAKTLVVLLSPSSKASEWVRIEIHSAREYKIPIFPVLIAGDKRTSVPPVLTLTQWQDVRRSEIFEEGIGKLIQELKAQLSTKQKGRTKHTAASNIGELDLSGRVDDYRTVTAMTLLGNVTASIAIPSAEKKLLFQELKKIRPHWDKTRTNAYIYATLCFILAQDQLEGLDRIIIDNEYEGYQGVIKDRFMRLCRRHNLTVPRNKILFAKLGKSKAHEICISILRGNTKADRDVTAGQVLREFQRNK